jgi:signal transduction histidine kinase
MNGLRYLAFATLTCSMAFAQGHTAAQAEKIVKRAIVYAKQNGIEKLIAQTNQANGVFHVGSGSDLYLIVLDKKGILRANGFKLDLVGTNRLVVKDVDGKFYMRELLELAKTKPSGWVDYKFSNPMTGKIEQKSTYFEVFEDYAIACGIYKP